jgi:hypothetical protein
MRKKKVDKSDWLARTARLPEEVVIAWHSYAIKTKQGKEEALAELIQLGSKCKKLVRA